MLLYAGPVLYALALWWASTGAVLRAGGLPRRVRGLILVGATLALVPALALVGTVRDRGVGEVYLGFTAALVAWGWIETGFVTGVVTGPQRAACPPGLAGWRRLSRAVGVVLYHDLAILAGAVLVAALSGGPGTTAGGTFLILAAMRLSAQVNLFLGVPNRAEDMLPDHLGYVASYFRDRPMNPLLPVSVAAGTALAALLVLAALAPEASDAQAARATLLAALVGLAVLEHGFLVLPVPVAALWRAFGRDRGEATRGLAAEALPDPLFCAARRPFIR